MLLPVTDVLLPIAIVEVFAAVAPVPNASEFWPLALAKVPNAVAFVAFADELVPNAVALLPDALELLPIAFEFE